MTHPNSRRAFLQTTGATLLMTSSGMGALHAATPPTGSSSENFAPASPPAPDPSGQPLPKLNKPMPRPKDQQIGFAIVGLGAYALNEIIPNIGATEHCRLAAIVSGNDEKRNQVGEAYGVPKEHRYGYATFDRIASDDSVDVVYIILPNTMHREWTERAFRAGKHVLCEKPLAPTAEECEAMIAAGKAAGKYLMTAYRAQYDPYNLKAIELTRNGIGKPNFIVADHGRILDLEMTRDQWRAKKELAGGGSLYDIGIYSLNGCRYLLGEEPTSVTARYHPGEPTPGVTVEEGIQWTLHFPSGAMANCSSSYRLAGNKRIHVQGSEGEVTLDPATDYYERNLYHHTEDGKLAITIPQANQFAAMLDEMALSVKERRAPKTPGEEGLRDVRILEAIYRAAESGGVVRL